MHITYQNMRLLDLILWVANRSKITIDEKVVHIWGVKSLDFGLSNSNQIIHGKERKQFPLHVFYAESSFSILTDQCGEDSFK